MHNISAYAFRNEDNSIMTLDSIGWQKIDSPNYSFSGDERPDCGHVIFQYTLGGLGYIEVENQTISMQKGSAFLVKIPSHHRYYYAAKEQAGEQKEPWEMIWLNIRGEEANRIWDIVIEQEGHIITRELNSPLIQNFWKLLQIISEEKITDKYRLSAAVYEWLLILVQTSKDKVKEITPASMTIIEKTKHYLREHYASPVTLDNLAEHCEINKHYLCRLFQKSESTSPLAYLQERRIEAAIVKLRTTELPIYEIGKQCGFDSPSYFGKVFRKYMFMTPQQYRMKKLEFPYDAIYYE